MSSKLLSTAERANDLIVMCQIAEHEQFSFETVFCFLNEHRTEQRSISPVFKEFLLWLLDQIYENPSRDKGDYVLQTISIAVEHNNQEFFKQVVQHRSVGKSAWPMLGVCSQRNFNLMEVLFDLYSEEHITVLTDFMLKSNLKEGVREHLEHNILRKKIAMPSQTYFEKCGKCC